MYIFPSYRSILEGVEKTRVASTFDEWRPLM